MFGFFLWKAQKTSVALCSTSLQKHLVSWEISEEIAQPPDFVFFWETPKAAAALCRAFWFQLNTQTEKKWSCPENIKTTAVALCQNYPLNETRKHTSFTEIGSSMDTWLWLWLLMDGYSTLIVQWLKKLTHLASVAGYLVSLGAKSISTTCSHSPNKSWISDWRIPCFLAATALLTILMSRIFRGCSLVDAS